jgi:hypothetical protein
MRLSGHTWEYLWPTLARCPLVARSQSSTLQPTTCLLSIPFPQCDNNHDMPRLHCRGAAASAGTTILSPCRFWRSEYANQPQSFLAIRIRQSTPIGTGTVLVKSLSLQSVMNLMRVICTVQSYLTISTCYIMVEPC